MEPHRAGIRARLIQQARSAWFHLAAIISGIALGLLGPFGTFAALPLASVVLFWVLICWINALQVLGLLIWLTPQGEAEGSPAVYGRLAQTGLLSAVPCTLEVWLLLGWLGMEPATPLWPGLLVLYAQCVLITMILCAVFTFVTRFRWAQDAPQPQQQAAMVPTPDASAFAARIPARVAGTLLAVSAEDHYLNIQTSAGTALVAGRFGDALDELADTDGVQIHRSHWVAHTAIERVHRRDGRTEVELTNGERLPVARSRAASLRKLGW